MSKSLTAVVLLLLAYAGPVLAAEQDASLEQFLQTAFAASGQAHADKPTSKTLWLNAELKQTLKQRFSYNASQLRLRYWQLDDRSAWILDEVGKERPITIGVAVDGHKITQVNILVYRESRGGEVEQRFFTDQFKGAQLVRKQESPVLDQHIDGITGATLSVRAVKKVATIALFLDALVRDKNPT